jgi:hypothetical protein
LLGTLNHKEFFASIVAFGGTTQNFHEDAGVYRRRALLILLPIPDRRTSAGRRKAASGNNFLFRDSADADVRREGTALRH